MLSMATWQQTKQPPKTKDQLRQMLAEAVRNTAQPPPKRRPSSKARKGQR
jgi:hypothetical protein